MFQVNMIFQNQETHLYQPIQWGFGCGKGSYAMSRPISGIEQHRRNDADLKQNYMDAQLAQWRRKN